MNNNNNNNIDPWEVLGDAAKSGDVDYLSKKLGECVANNHDYSPLLYSNFKVMYHPKKEDGGGNILHLAARNYQEKFFKKAIEGLPRECVHKLLCQPLQTTLFNPLHLALMWDPDKIVKHIISFYCKSSSAYVPPTSGDHNWPWLAQDNQGFTSLHHALSDASDELALEILGMDHSKELLHINTFLGESLLYCAVQFDRERFALQILTSQPLGSYSLSGFNRLTPLHIVCESSEAVLVQLLQKHPELIDNVDNIAGDTVLDSWLRWGNDVTWASIEKVIKSGKISFETLRRLVNAVYTSPDKSEFFFKEAVKKNKYSASKTIAKLYNICGGEVYRLPPPWKQNYDAVKFMCKTNNLEEKLTVNIIDGQYDEVFGAISHGDNIRVLYMMIRRLGWNPTTPSHKKILLNALKPEYPVVVPQWIIKNFPETFCDELDTHEKLWVLDKALERGLHLIVEEIPKCELESIIKEVWVIEACRKGHLELVITLINKFPANKRLFIGDNNPLHHIQHKGVEQYKEFLKQPIIRELVNSMNSDGATPLHTAIYNDNIHLAEALITDKVKLNIEDKGKGKKTSLSLLAEKSKENKQWDDMCTRAGISSLIRTSHFQSKENMLDFRNALSVVAALLATITFTAGFTLPGGVQSDSTGGATLGNRAAFWAFLIADTFAMCCSMFVLVCLMWSMTTHDDMSLLLIDKSMSVIRFALNSTIVAFMTGIYVVMPHKSLWVTIVILVMCSMLIILSQRHIVLKIVNMTTYGVLAKKEVLKIVNMRTCGVFAKKKDDAKLLEEGLAGKTE